MSRRKMPTREEVEELGPGLHRRGVGWRWCERHDRVETQSDWYSFYPCDEPLEVFLKAVADGTKGLEGVWVTDTGYESPGVAFFGWKPLEETDGSHFFDEFWKALERQRAAQERQRQTEEEQLADLKKRRPDLFEDKT